MTAKLSPTDINIICQKRGEEPYTCVVHGDALKNIAIWQDTDPIYAHPVWSISHINTGYGILFHRHEAKRFVIKAARALDPLFDDMPEDFDSDAYKEWATRVVPEVKAWMSWLDGK